MGKDAWNLDIIQSDIVQDQIGDFFNSVYDYIIPTLKWWQKWISVICSKFDSFILKDYYIKVDKEKRCHIYFKDTKLGTTKFFYKKKNKAKEKDYDKKKSNRVSS
jgi:hypothetical protein